MAVLGKANVLEEREEPPVIALPSFLKVYVRLTPAAAAEVQIAFKAAPSTGAESLNVSTGWSGGPRGRTKEDEIVLETAVGFKTTRLRYYVSFHFITRVVSASGADTTVSTGLYNFT